MQKRKLVLAIGICMVVVFLALLAVNGAIASVTVPQVGDANGSGTIDMGDVTAIYRMILGLDPVKSWADANWDGDVNMGDVVRIQRIILGLSPVVHP